MILFTRLRSDILRRKFTNTENQPFKEKYYKNTSPYYARIVSMCKRNGSLRLCVDLRPLNAFTNSDSRSH